MRLGKLVSVAVVLTLVLLAPAAQMAPVSAAAPDGSTIEIWVRKQVTTPTGGDTGGRERLEVLQLDGLPLIDSKRLDIQYHGAFTYRGVEIRALIDRYHPPGSVDL